MKQMIKEPTAKVSVNKSLLKKYNVKGADCYFLEDGSNFEIELFNPLQETILCKIVFNGERGEQEGLVLRPGERVFLERYLESNNKFVFETYEVDDSEETEFAIKKNGLVRITFHKEVWNWPNYSTATYTSPYITIPSNPNIFYCDSTSGTLTSGSCTTTITNMATAASYTLNGAVEIGAISDMVNTVETGRIEKGDESNQSFAFVNRDFSYSAFHFVEFKLLPQSHKSKTSDDLKVRKYCTQCGKKAKAKDKFCSACGNKLK